MFYFDTFSIRARNISARACLVTLEELTSSLLRLGRHRRYMAILLAEAGI